MILFFFFVTSHKVGAYGTVMSVMLNVLNFSFTVTWVKASVCCTRRGHARRAGAGVWEVQHGRSAAQPRAM